MMLRLLALAIPALLSSTAWCQISIDVATYGSGVTGNGSTVIGPGTSLAPGILANGGTFRADLTETTTPTSTRIALSTSAGGAPIGQTVGAGGMLELTIRSQELSAIELVLEVDQDVASTTGTTFCSASNDYRIAVAGNPLLLPPCSGNGCRVEQTGLAVAPGAPLVVQLDVSSAASSSSGFGLCFGNANAECSVTVRRTSGATSYGAPCGTDMRATPLLSGRNDYLIEVSDPSMLPLGVLLIGTNPLAAPLPWNCTLYTDLAIGTAPLAVDGNGDATISLRFPSGTWTLQAGTFGGTTIHMSAGIAVFAP